jgi:PKD repeat protein
VNPASVAGTISGTATVCSGTNNTTLTLSGNMGAVQWQSSSDTTNFINIIGATAQTYTATNLNSTTYYRAVVTSGVCTAANTASATITVNPTPVAGTVSGAGTVCSGSNSATLTLSGNTGTIQWQSSSNNTNFTNINGATTQTYTATNLTATTYYRAVVTNGSCVAITSSSTITVNPLPVLSTSGTVAAVCFSTANQSTTLPYLSSNSPVSYSIDWSATANQAGLLDQSTTAFVFAAGAGTVTGIVIPGSTAAGTYAGVISIASSNGCVSTSNISITINALPAVPVISTASNNLCIGSSLVLSTNGSASLQWYRNNVAITNATSSTLTVSQSGDYKVVSTSIAGCVRSSLVSSITSSAVPVAGFSVNKSNQCLKDNSFEFINESKLDTGKLSYSWTFGDGDTSVLLSPIKSFKTAGTYNLTLVVKSDKGCESRINQSVTVYDQPIEPDLISTDSSLCTGRSLLLTTNGDQFLQWYKDSVLLVGSTSSSLLVNKGGKYRVQNRDNNGCVSESVLQLIVENPMPMAGFTLNNAVQCFDENRIITTNSSKISSGLMSYEWSFGDSTYSSALNPIHSYKKPGIYRVWLKVSGVGGCSDSMNRVVTIKDLPIKPNVNVVGNTVLCEGGRVFLIADDQFKYQWYRNGSPIVADTNKVLRVEVGGIYQVRGYSAQGCYSGLSDALKLVVGVSPSVPEVKDLMYCINALSKPLTAQGTVGNALLWYTPLTGDTAKLIAPVPSTSRIGNFEYYVSQRNAEGCEGEKVKLVVRVGSIVRKPEIKWDGGFLSTDAGYESYAWSADNKLVETNTLGIHKPKVGGSYRVKVSNQFGCVDSSAVYVLVVTGVSNATVDNTIKMKVYPNPSQSKVWIDIGERPSKEVTLRLLDLKGRVVYQTKTKQQTTMINWSGMVSGTYMVEAVNGTSRKTMKVLKE